MFSPSMSSRRSPFPRLIALMIFLQLPALAAQAEDRGKVRSQFFQEAVERSATEDLEGMLADAAHLESLRFDRATYEDLGQRLLAAARIARLDDDVESAQGHLRAAEYAFTLAQKEKEAAGKNFFLHRAMVAIEEVLVSHSDTRWDDARSWLNAHLKAYTKGPEADWARRILANPDSYTHAEAWEGLEGPLYVGGDVQAPVKIFYPHPIYTELARENRLQGVVIMQVVIDQHGNVSQSKVLKGLPMGLEEQATKAVSTWLFEPARLNGQAISVYYNLTINFRMNAGWPLTDTNPRPPRPTVKPSLKPSLTADPAAGPLYVGGEVKAPVKVHAEAPTYTEEAREARLQGVVIMQVVIDRNGKVTRSKILKGLAMGLGERAKESVSQWQFEPATLNGQPVEVYYNLTVNFRLE